MEKYRESIAANEHRSFRNILKTKLSLCGYLSYYPCPKSGSMFYNASIISGGGLKLLYKLLNKADTSNNSQSKLNTDYIRTLIKRQIALSNRSHDFDYRQLFEGNDGTSKSTKLDQYFDPELLKFVDDVTLSDTNIHTNTMSIQHSYSRKLKCMMICAIMANTMDPRNCLIQTLIGLACYAQGLRDKGIKLLNAFGVSCSVFHIRQHGSWWAKMCDAINEINPRAWW